MIPNDSHETSLPPKRPKEPTYRKRRRSDLHHFNVAVEVQSYVDAKALARRRNKPTGELIDDLIKAEVARELDCR